MICAVVAPAISADVTNPRRRLCAPMASTSLDEAPTSRKSRFTTSATSRPSIRVSRNSPCGENATNSGPLLLLEDVKPRFDRRDRARPVLEPRHRHELPRPTLVGLALADRYNEEAGPAEVEVLDVEPGDLGPSPPRSKRQQQNRAITNRERRRRRPLEFDARGEPLGGNRGTPVVVATG